MLLYVQLAKVITNTISYNWHMFIFRTDVSSPLGQFNKVTSLKGGDKFVTP